MKKKQSNGKKIFIYFRYIFGVALALLILAGMFIPCLKYTVGENSNQPISAISLVKNSWETSRIYLFDGASDKQVEQTSFSKALLASVILLVTLFAIGVIFSLYTAYCAFAYFKDPKVIDKNRIFFLTLVPNRIVLCIYSALLLPLAFLPRIIVPLYENILNYQTVLFPSVFEPWIIALVLYVAFVTVVFLSAKYEKQLGCDPLYNEVKEKLKREKKRVMTYAEEQVEEKEEKEDTVKMSIDDILREDQAERIRKMFSDNRENDK